MYCDDCGTKLPPRSIFCDNCGRQFAGKSQSPNKAHSHILDGFFGKKSILITLAMFAVGIVVYFFLNDAASIRDITNQLKAAQKDLQEFQASTTDTLVQQAVTIESQKKQLAVQAVSQNTITSSPQTNNYSSLVNKFGVSIVEIICSSNARQDSFQQGSGTLYKTDDASQPYVVWTNLHVVKTDDGSNPQCAIAIHPNISSSFQYLVFSAVGYKYIDSSTDFAELTPSVTTGKNAGSLSDLAKYSIQRSDFKLCQNPSTGEGLVVLGYPAVGGSTLTVTEGIVSGFEYSSGVKYAKTSAKIDHGDSGGLALLSSGCVLGIPTYVESGQLESIGRILDLTSIRSKLNL